MSDEKLTNNPPAAVLELTEAQAKFLLENCSKNIQFVLNAMMREQLAVQQGAAPLFDRAALEKLIAVSDQFKEIREMLRKQGIKEDE